MSDYYGRATLEDWLVEEVLGFGPTPDMVALFERWRPAVERNVAEWMETDDGDGNNVSWRQWGRGFYAIPKEEEAMFEHARKQAMSLFATGCK